MVVDFTILEKDQRECENVMVMTDVFFFPKYAVAVATRDQKAATVARALVEF